MDNIEMYEEYVFDDVEVENYTNACAGDSESHVNSRISDEPILSQEEVDALLDAIAGDSDDDVYSEPATLSEKEVNNLLCTIGDNTTLGLAELNQENEAQDNNLDQDDEYIRYGQDPILDILLDIEHLIDIRCSIVSKICHSFRTFANIYGRGVFSNNVENEYYLKFKEFKKDKKCLLEDIQYYCENYNEEEKSLISDYLPLLVNNAHFADTTKIKKYQNRLNQILEIIRRCKGDLIAIREFKNSVGFVDKDVQFIKININKTANTINKILESLLEFQLKYNEGITDSRFRLKGNIIKICMHKYSFSDALTKISENTRTISTHLWNFNTEIEKFKDKIKFINNEPEQFKKEEKEFWKVSIENIETIEHNEKKIEYYLLYLMNDIDSIDSGNIEEYQEIVNSIIKNTSSFEKIIEKIRIMGNAHEVKEYFSKNIVNHIKRLVSQLNILSEMFLKFNKKYNEGVYNTKLHLKGTWKKIFVETNIQQNTASKLLTTTNLPWRKKRDLSPVWKFKNWEKAFERAVKNLEKKKRYLLPLKNKGRRSPFIKNKAASTWHSTPIISQIGMRSLLSLLDSEVHNIYIPLWQNDRVWRILEDNSVDYKINLGIFKDVIQYKIKEINEKSKQSKIHFKYHDDVIFWETLPNGWRFAYKPWLTVVFSDDDFEVSGKKCTFKFYEKIHENVLKGYFKRIYLSPANVYIKDNDSGEIFGHYQNNIRESILKFHKYSSDASRDKYREYEKETEELINKIKSEKKFDIIIDTMENYLVGISNFVTEAISKILFGIKSNDEIGVMFAVLDRLGYFAVFKDDGSVDVVNDAGDSLIR